MLPFITCQWKSAKSGQSHWHAMRQGARDGAAIVNNKCQMFEYAKIDYTEVDTCHFSATCDSEYMALYVHWRGMKNGKKRFYMRRIGRAFFASDEDSETANPDMVIMRQRLHNLLDYHLNDGLRRSHELMQAIQVRKQGPAPAPTPASATRHSGRVAATAAAHAPPALAPAPPNKKRRGPGRPRKDEGSGGA